MPAKIPNEPLIDPSLYSRGSTTNWINSGEAARRLGIGTVATLYRFIDEGRLPAYRFGRVIRLKGADVDAYLESCRIQPGSLQHLYPHGPVVEINPLDRLDRLAR